MNEDTEIKNPTVANLLVFPGLINGMARSSDSPSHD